MKKANVSRSLSSESYPLHSWCSSSGGTLRALALPVSDDLVTNVELLTEFDFRFACPKCTNFPRHEIIQK